MVGSAATVWLRFPPPSCIRITEPLCTFASARRTITDVPGRDQSRVSIVQTRIFLPSAAALRETSLFVEPYGGRRQRGVYPVWARMYRSVVRTWDLNVAAETFRRSGCDQVWFCTLLPIW